MRKDLDDLLCQRYPQIFADRHLSMRESLMYWGMACGDGWFALLDTLCARLQFETDHNGAPQVVAVQVKQKMGELRVHVRGANDFQRGLLAFAAAMSRRTCEECGNPGQPINAGGFLTVRCATHTPADAVPASENSPSGAFDV